MRNVPLHPFGLRVERWVGGRAEQRENRPQRRHHESQASPAEKNRCERRPLFRRQECTNQGEKRDREPTSETPHHRCGAAPHQRRALTSRQSLDGERRWGEAHAPIAPAPKGINDVGRKPVCFAHGLKAPTCRWREIKTEEGRADRLHETLQQRPIDNRAGERGNESHVGQNAAPRIANPNRINNLEQSCIVDVGKFVDWKLRQRSERGAVQLIHTIF